MPQAQRKSVYESTPWDVVSVLIFEGFEVRKGNYFTPG